MNALAEDLIRMQNDIVHKAGELLVLKCILMTSFFVRVLYRLQIFLSLENIKKYSFEFIFYTLESYKCRPKRMEIIYNRIIGICNGAASYFCS